MTRIIAYITLLVAYIAIDACQTKDPVLVAPAGAVAVAKVNPDKAYFDTKDLTTAEFEFSLRGEDFGQGVTVTGIELWVGYNNPKVTLTASMTSCGVGVGCLYPNAALAPLPSRLALPGDQLLRTVTTLPSTVTIKASELATKLGLKLTDLKANDTFQVKFVVLTADGRRFDAFHDGICDETRGQIGDCRLVIRVDTRKTLYQTLK